MWAATSGATDWPLLKLQRGRSSKRMGDCTSSREKAFQRTKVGDTVLSSRTVHFAAVPTVDVMVSKPAPACRVVIGVAGSIPSLISVEKRLPGNAELPAVEGDDELAVQPRPVAVESGAQD